MECINKVEILGIIGGIYIAGPEGSKETRFSVATNSEYKSKEGSIVVDTTWHNVYALESEVGDLSALQKGAVVHVWGSTRTRNYTTADGSWRSANEIKANRVKIIKEG